jgi:5-(carboxyamino)imidazole ribonucleotide synthase
VELIQDKGRQKLFFRERQIPSADFLILDSRADLQSKSKFLPAVQKLRIGGYDGRGVKILNQAVDAASAFDAPSVLEKKIDLALELAVIVCRASDGSFRSFDPVGMVVDPKLNLLDHLIAPAEVSQDLLKEAVRLAELVANAFGITGILAVEMFLSRSGELLINEVAPRPHNSGHHTIEACPSSQYDQLARILLDLPLGETSASSPALLFNLLGEPGNTGQAVLMGKDQAEKITGVRVHDYGKIETKPGRKMGHLTILGKDAKELRQKLASVRGLVKYLAKEES